MKYRIRVARPCHPPKGDAETLKFDMDGTGLEKGDEDAVRIP
jgi:hypothetical protein